MPRCLSDSTPMDIMTAAATTPHSPSTPGHAQRFYVAFRSTDPGFSGHFGYGVCSYTYEGTNSINYELSGRIDPKKTSANFTCDREQLDALLVVRANDGGSHTFTSALCVTTLWGGESGWLIVFGIAGKRIEFHSG